MRVRQQRGAGQQEDQRELGQQDGQCDLVRRLAARCAFDHRDHAVEEALARIAGDAHDQPVGQHPRAAGDGTAIAAGFADDRCGFTGDRTFVDVAAPFDDFAVAGNLFAGFDQDEMADAQVRMTVRTSPPHHDRGLAIAWRSRPARTAQALRPGPCRAPRPALRRNWRTAP